MTRGTSLAEIFGTLLDIDEFILIYNQERPIDEIDEAGWKHALT